MATGCGLQNARDLRTEQEKVCTVVTGNDFNLV